VALVVSLIALGPVFDALAPNLPLTMQPVTVPHWFTTEATHLSAEQVLATYPFATADSQASMPWQAIPGLYYKMAGGGGPAGTVARAGADKDGFNVLNMASVPLGPAPVPTMANLDAVRRALRHWGVTMVVVPDDAGLPVFDRGRGSAYGVAFFTAVLGSAPHRQDGAWVWADLPSTRAAVAMSPLGFSACVHGGVGGGGDGDSSARCVLRAALPPAGHQDIANQASR
jgi:hypothetical protein